MNHNYESVQQILAERGIDIPESYIGRALKEYNLERFPEAGLSNVGLTRLVNTAVDIYHSEVDLSKRKPQRKKMLEMQLIEKEVENLWGITACLPVGVTLTIPTMFRKARDYDECHLNQHSTPTTLIVTLFANINGYTALAQSCPELILPIALTQIGTNLASGIYEYIRNVKKRARGDIPPKKEGMPFFWDYE